MKNKSLKICTRCIQDETVPGITFDNNGVCNYCHLHDELCEIFKPLKRVAATFEFKDSILFVSNTSSDSTAFILNNIGLIINKSNIIIDL